MNKILFSINDLKRFLHVREIAEYIIEREPTIKAQGFTDLIGRHIYKYKTDGLVVPYKVGTSHRNTFYGLPAWLDEFGKPKEGFGVNTGAMIDKVYGDITIVDEWAMTKTTIDYNGRTLSMENLPGFINPNTTPPEGGAKLAVEKDGL